MSDEVEDVIAHALRAEMPGVDHPAMEWRNQRDRHYAAVDVLEALTAAGFKVVRMTEGEA